MDTDTDRVGDIEDGRGEEVIASKGHLMIRAEYNSDGSVSYHVMVRDTAKRIIVLEAEMTTEEYLELITNTHDVEVDYTLTNPL